MKKIFMLCTFFCLTFVLVCCEGKGAINTYEAQIVNVYDGDTMTVLDADQVKHKVRLYAIDAPELQQEGGRESLEHLVWHIMDAAKVKVEVHNIDLYGREVAVVYVDDVNLNRQQISCGYAWHYKQYDKLFKEEFSALERTAREQEMGIWKFANPQPPWEFRSAKRKG